MSVQNHTSIVSRLSQRNYRSRRRAQERASPPEVEDEADDEDRD